MVPARDYGAAGLGKSGGNGSEVRFQALVRVDSPLEAEQYRHGGILPLILRKMLRR